MYSLINLFMLIYSCYAPSTFISAGRPSRSSSTRQPSSQRRSSRPRPAPSAAQPVPPTARPAVSANTAAPATGRRATRQGRQHPVLKGHHRRQLADARQGRHRRRVTSRKGRLRQVLRQRDLFPPVTYKREDRAQAFTSAWSGSPTTHFRGAPKSISMGNPGESGHLLPSPRCRRPCPYNSCQLLRIQVPS